MSETKRTTIQMLRGLPFIMENLHEEGRIWQDFAGYKAMAMPCSVKDGIFTTANILTFPLAPWRWSRHKCGCVGLHLHKLLGEPVIRRNMKFWYYKTGFNILHNMLLDVSRVYRHSHSNYGHKSSRCGHMLGNEALMSDKGMFVVSNFLHHQCGAPNRVYDAGARYYKGDLKKIFSRMLVESGLEP